MKQRDNTNYGAMLDPAGTRGMGHAADTSVCGTASMTGVLHAGSFSSGDNGSSGTAFLRPAAVCEDHFN